MIIIHPFDNSAIVSIHNDILTGICRGSLFIINIVAVVIYRLHAVSVDQNDTVCSGIDVILS